MSYCHNHNHGGIIGNQDSMAWSIIISSNSTLAAVFLFLSGEWRKKANITTKYILLHLNTSNKQVTITGHFDLGWLHWHWHQRKERAHTQILINNKNKLSSILWTGWSDCCLAAKLWFQAADRHWLSSSQDPPGASSSPSPGAWIQQTEHRSSLAPDAASSPDLPCAGA